MKLNEVKKLEDEYQSQRLCETFDFLIELVFRNENLPHCLKVACYIRAPPRHY